MTDSELFLVVQYLSIVVVAEARDVPLSTCIAQSTDSTRHTVNTLIQQTNVAVAIFY